MSDKVRVLRIIEYTGERAIVERTVSRSLHGSHTFGGITIRAATLGEFPEILESAILRQCEYVDYLTEQHCVLGYDHTGPHKLG